MMSATRPRVLVVDDDPDLLKLLSIRLRAAGYDVKSAESGEAALAQLSLSRPQAAAGMSINELSRFLLVSRQNLAGLLGRLEREGLVARATSETDRRSRRVKLTSKGQRLWTSLQKPIHAFYNDALRGFSFDDRIAFIHYVNLLQKNMASAASAAVDD